MNSLLCAALTCMMAMAPAWATSDCDVTLNAGVRAALYRDLGPAARDIEVDSHGGTVRLRGKLASYALWRAAEDSAVGVQGVNHVLNHMDAPQDRPLAVH